MNFKKLALAAAAAATATSVQAADLPVAAEPVNYVQACDAFGAGFFQLPGKETCIKLGGRIRANYVSHDLNQDLGEVTTEAVDAETIEVFSNAGVVTVVTRDANGDIDTSVAGQATLTEDDVTTVTVSEAEEEETNDYDAYVRGYLYFTSMTATDFGTIKTFTELTATWNDEGTDSHGTGDVYVQLGTSYGEFLVGRTASLFDAFTGYTWIGPADTDLSDGSALQAKFTADLGNGVTAAVAVQDSTYRGGEDNALDVLGALNLTQGWGSFKLAGVAFNRDEEDEWGYGVGATATFNLDMLKDGAEVTFQAQYADEAGQYIDADEDDTGYALAVGFSTPLTEKLSAQLDASYLDLDNDADYNKTAVNGSLVYSPAAGLGLALAAGWEQADEDGEDHDAITKVGARVQYTF